MKHIAKVLVIWFAVVALVGLSIGEAKGSSSSSSGGRSSSSFSSSKSSSSFSTSKPSTGSSISTSKPTGSSYNTTATNNANAQKVATPAPSSTPSSSPSTSSSHYYGGSSDGFGSGFFSGMILGNVMSRPAVVATPGVYGGHVAAPMTFSIIGVIIDLIVLSLFIWLLYYIYKRYKGRY